MDISKIDTIEKSRNLMANAKRLRNVEVYRAAFRRRCELEGAEHTDPVIAQFWGAVAALEELLREKHGKAVPTGFTKQKVKKLGEIRCLEDWVLKNPATEGFRKLVDGGLPDLTGEHVIITHSDRFSAEAVVAANARLSAPAPTESNAASQAV